MWPPAPACPCVRPVCARGRRCSCPAPWAPVVAPPLGVRRSAGRRLRRRRRAPAAPVSVVSGVSVLPGVTRIVHTKEAGRGPNCRKPDKGRERAGRARDSEPTATAPDRATGDRRGCWRSPKVAIHDHRNSRSVITEIRDLGSALLGSQAIDHLLSVPPRAVLPVDMPGV